MSLTFKPKKVQFILKNGTKCSGFEIEFKNCEVDMSKELNYTSENLFDLKCLVESWKNEIQGLNVQKKVIDGKIEVLYENIDRLERHILEIEEQNNSAK